MQRFIAFILIFFLSFSLTYSQDSRENKLQKSVQRAEILDQKVKLDEAISVAENVVENYKKTAGKSFAYATSLVNLAELRKQRFLLLKQIPAKAGLASEEITEFLELSKDDKDKTETLMREALEVYAELSGGDSLAVASLKIELAEFFDGNAPSSVVTTEKERKSFFSKVEQLYLEALSTQEKIAGIDSDLTLKTVASLGDFYLARVDFENALKLYERHLEVSEKRYGANHKNIVLGLRRVGKIYAVTDREAEAAKLAERASAITGKTEKYFPSNLNLIDRAIKIKTISSTPLYTFDPNDSRDVVIGSKEATIASTITNSVSFKKIVVNILIDESGKVIEAKVTGETKKMKEIEKAARQAIFRPFVYQGVSRKMRGVISYSFVE